MPRATTRNDECRNQNDETITNDEARRTGWRGYWIWWGIPLLLAGLYVGSYGAARRLDLLHARIIVSEGHADVSMVANGSNSFARRLGELSLMIFAPLCDAEADRVKQSFPDDEELLLGGP